MDNYVLVEYRPGRWVRVDAETGDFLGPATPEEVRAWQRDREAFVDGPPTSEQINAHPTRTTRSSAQPALSYDRHPLSPERDTESLSTQRSAAEGQAGAPVPQQSTPEKVEAPSTPQQIAPEEKAGVPIPLQPTPEKAAAPPTPEQPTPEKRESPSSPQQPAPEQKEEPSAPSQPIPKPEGAGQAGEAGPVFPLERRFVITSTFADHNNRTPPSTAPGLDFGCPVGTPIRAWAKGKVIRSRWSAGGGRSLWIQHGGSIRTYYAHLNCVCVLEGETVSAGQQIGETGNTGHTTGPHLHFSVIRKGQFADPEKFLVFDQAPKV